MAEKTRQPSGTQSLDSIMDFEDHELQTTLHDFLEDDKKENTNIWNFATIAGIAMFFVGVVSMVQLIGVSIGPDLLGLVTYLPLIGGLLVTLVGFGYFVGDRKKEKRAKKKQRKEREQRKSRNYGFESGSGKEDHTLHNDLGTKGEGRSHSKERSTFDRYAFKKSKKLYKSRSNKKISGVCGGLAEYLGISSTVVRLLFIITFFAGSGTSFLLYLALAFALDKEPVEFDEKYDF